MGKLYKYTGTVFLFNYQKITPNSRGALFLHDMYDINKAPIRIEATCGLADYINAIECADAEEFYLTANWYYDRSLHLFRIEIPSVEPGNPAKIIAQHNLLDHTVSVFGPVDYIETSEPEPMTSEQRSAWYEFKADDNNIYTT